MLFSIDKQTCIKCGHCVAACPAFIIAREDDDPPYSIPENEAGCIKCGHCAAICPSGALDLKFMPLADMPPSDYKPFSKEQTEAFIRNRRSIRRYSDKKVDQQTLQELIQLSGYAPSAKNGQMIGWAVHSNPRLLAEMFIDWLMDLQNSDPKTFTFVRGDTLLARWKRGVDPIARNAPHVVVVYSSPDWPMGAVDTVIAMSYMELIAPSLGLGACWAGYLMRTLNTYQPIREAFGLSDQKIAHGALMLGYPEYGYHHWPLRKQPNIMWK